jgi:dienelactone hydrolase
VPYQVSDSPFEGTIVSDDTVQRKRAVVFMQPNWKGVCADTVAQARAVAGENYVVLMADMFGAGYGDTPKTREHLAAGMKAVRSARRTADAKGTAQSPRFVDRQSR